jgi:hypothetical protein
MALQHASLVWFTLSRGIINEVYYPRVDLACIRDFGLIVTDGQAFFSEEKRHTRSQVASVADGVPADQHLPSGTLPNRERDRCRSTAGCASATGPLSDQRGGPPSP